MTVEEPSDRDLVVFGVLLPVFVAAAGFALGQRLGSPAVERGVWLAGGLLCVVYLALPARRRLVFTGIGRVTHPIGVVVSSVILLVVFLVVVTPIAALLRLARRDPLERRPDPAAPTYWVEHARARDQKRYLRQF